MEWIWRRDAGSSCWVLLPRNNLNSFYINVKSWFVETGEFLMSSLDFKVKDAIVIDRSNLQDLIETFGNQTCFTKLYANFIRGAYNVFGLFI